MENSWLKSELPSGSIKKREVLEKPQQQVSTPSPPPRRHDMTSTTISEIQIHALENNSLNQDEDLQCVN